MERLTELLGYWNDSLPEKVDYADLVCAPAFARGHRMVYEDEYGYVVEETIKTLEELQQYRKLEEDGLLLRLPCKVGDIVYNKKLEKLYVIEIRIADDICFHCCKDRENSIWTGSDFSADDFGKVAFLTHEEAEAKLAEMEDGHE